MRGSEKSPSRGRIRLGVLIATVAAFLLVPAAQAAAGTVTVNIEGTGSGEVNTFTGFFGAGITEPPIACSYTSPGPASGTCEAEMEFNEEFETYMASLEATPSPGSEFFGWVFEGNSGSFGCEGNGDKGASQGGGSFACAVLDESGNDVTVTAFFEEEGEELPAFPLTVTLEGTGEGTVTSTPAGIECGTECEAEFEEGEEVELSQSAEAGSEFVEWGGACSGTGTCEVTMDEAKEVTASFDLEPTPEFTLEINIDGTGSGEVECKVEGGSAEPCEAEYEEGTEVALVSIADPGSEFTGWSEDCTGTGACAVAMDEDHSVTATFEEEEEPPTPEFKLTILKAGTGSGSVTCDGGACAAEYPEGEEVTLAATAASGSTFSGWSGGGCSGTAPCTVTIDADTTVTATFTASAKEEPKKEEPKPPTPEGKAKAAATAKVKSGKASLKLTCTGGPCKGTIQLKAKVKQGKKTKTLVIGKASFSIADGASVTIKVKLSGPAKQQLAKGKALKAKTSGSGVSASTVKLKPAKK